MARITHTPAKPTAASLDAIEKHNCLSEDGNIVKHIEKAVREEGTQMYQQAMGFQKRAHLDLEAEPVGTDSEDDTSSTPLQSSGDIAQAIRLYHNGPGGGVTPMQRFLAMSPLQEPFPLSGKRAMSDMELDYGSLETIDKRTQAVEAIGGGNQSHIAPCDVEFNDPRPHSAPAAFSTRVLKAKVMIRRQRVSPPAGEGKERKRQKRA